MVYNEKNIFFLKEKKNFCLRQTIAFEHKTQLQASSQPNEVGGNEDFCSLLLSARNGKVEFILKKVFPGSHWERNLS